MKKALIVVIIVILSILFLSVVRDQLIKTVVTMVAGQVTGAKVGIERLSIGLTRSYVEIRNFKMYNPKGFSKGVLVDLPKVIVRYNLPALLTGKMYFSLVDVELRELGLEKNKNGQLNVDSLKVFVKAEPKKQEEKKEGKPLAMRIDLLKIKMGKIVSRDYTKGSQPYITVYNINLEKSYKNITSAQQLAALLLAEPMKQAGIKGAKIYGATLLTGFAVLPVTAVATFIGKDSAQEVLDIPIKSLYGASLKVLTRIGNVDEKNEPGLIKASVEGVNIAVQLKEASASSTEITISARKYLLPKPEVASGILYQIKESLKH